MSQNGFAVNKNTGNTIKYETIDHANIKDCLTSSTPSFCNGDGVLLLNPSEVRMTTSSVMVLGLRRAGKKKKTQKFSRRTEKTLKLKVEETKFCFRMENVKCKKKSCSLSKVVHIDLQGNL